MLLSVRELKDGSLALLPRSSKFHMDRDVDRPQIVEHHYSVHNSPHTFLNTFKDTFTLDDGRKKSVKFLSAAIKNDKFCLLFSRTVPNLTPPHFDVPNNQRDMLVSLGKYNYTKTTLVYSVVVSRAGRNLRTLEHWGAHVKHIDFTLYRVSLIYSLLNLPSPAECAIGMRASFSPGSPPDAQPIHPLDQGDDWEETTYAHFGSVNSLRPTLLGYIDHTSQTAVSDENLMQVDD